MRSFFKSAGFKVLLAFLAFLIGIMIYAVTKGGYAVSGESFINTITKPFRSVSNNISMKIESSLDKMNNADKYYEENHLRRYGFHGTSHGFVAEKAAKLIGKDWKDLKIISCHLGSGASITAVDHGRSVDTSLGMTPVEGLLMGSRCGDLDSGALLYLMDKENLTTKQASTILNKKSGLLGVSGDKQDMRDVRAGRDAGDERATYAFDMFAYRVKKYIGAYMAAMNGCDLLLFTGGIGENAWFMRRPILEDMDFFGIKVDFSKNDGVMGEDVILSTPDSKVAVVVVTTDEEFVIASDTYKLVTK